MSYTVCNVLDLGPAYTGVTLNAQLYDSGNGTVGSAITTGFYERSGDLGIYAFTLTVPDGHQGWCDVYVDGASATVLASLPINPAEVELAALKAQIVDALITDTYAEPSGVPTANTSLKNKIGWLFSLARNKILQTSSAQTLRNDADSADIAAASVSDDGSTFTRSEWS